MNQDNPKSEPNIVPVHIEDEMIKSYVNYALYVITHRALPNVDDGLKPVQRRALISAYQMGLFHNRPYKKTVRIVGDTMGKYHPHGDSAIYQALVRLSRQWVMRYPLIDGQGNFGSMDGDDAAAMRYTEARLERLTEDGLLADLSKDVVEFQSNFDGSLEEPLVLPARMPNLLMNGSSGIAVGMATHMPPHNLREVIAGILAYIEDNDITIEELMNDIKGPDFPTGGIIYGTEGIQKAFRTGKGQIVIRSKVTIDLLPNGCEQLVANELPYMVNKAQMIEKTAFLIQKKHLEGIADIRDESNKKGIRVVYDLKRGAVANVVLNNLYKHTSLQSTFSVNNVVLVDGKPQMVNLKDLIVHHVRHRHTVVTKRTESERRKAMCEKHLLEGYIIVTDHVEEIVKLIKQSQDGQEARKVLMASYDLSEIQVKAILDMRLQRLTGMERKRIIQQYQVVLSLITELEGILADKGKRMEIIKKELQQLNKRYGDDRRTVIEYDAEEFVAEDMIPNERMVITLSQQGYIKSTSLAIYKTQHRGGIGAKGVSSKKEDFLTQLFVASAHDYLLVFTEYGKVYSKRVYDLPKSGKTHQGRAIQNFLEIEPGDAVRSILKVEKLHEQAAKKKYVTFCTEKGIVKKTPLSCFARPRRRGIIAIKIKEGDRLLEVRLTEANHYIMLAIQSGKAIRFSQQEIRSMGRVSSGVRGITLAGPKDKVIGMISSPENEETSLLILSEKGRGKRSFMKDYRCTHRGGKGVKTIAITAKTGQLVAIKAVEAKDELIIMNSSGITLRTTLNKIRIMSRATQGVRIINVRGTDSIASAAIIKYIEEEVT